MIKLKRVYDPVSRTDGTRFLVERLWPRGLSKEDVHATAWLKEVGPSTELRQWFNHDPLKWSRFRTRYFRELDSRPESWRPIVTAARRGMVTLIYSSHDEKHNNAIAAGISASKGPHGFAGQALCRRGSAAGSRSMSILRIDRIKRGLR